MLIQLRQVVVAGGIYLEGASILELHWEASSCARTHLRSIAQIFVLHMQNVGSRKTVTGSWELVARIARNWLARHIIMS